MLAGAGGGPVVSLWDMDTGRRFRALRGASYDPSGVAFVANDSQLRAASGEGIDRGYLLDPIALTELARAEASPSLTDEESEQYLGGPCEGLDGGRRALARARSRCDLIPGILVP